MTVPHAATEAVLHSSSGLIGVLVSGGLDSAVLVAELAASRVVLPIYIRAGLAWEEIELEYCRNFLKRMGGASTLPLVVLEQPVADIYGSHWSLGGEGVPGADSPDEAVYLPGRNLLLLFKAMLYCHLHGVGEVALAVLFGNPFPDASPEFFESIAKVVNTAVGGDMKILLPYRQFRKGEVVRRGAEFPLEWTFSCIQPIVGVHCGHCNKCAERQAAFSATGVPDPTHYAFRSKERSCTE